MEDLVLAIDGKELCKTTPLYGFDIIPLTDDWPDEVTFKLTLPNGRKIYYAGKRAVEKES